MITDFHTGNLF